MKRILALLAISTLLTTLIVGCGFVSGTVFVSEEIEGDIVSDTRPGDMRGMPGSLDVNIEGREIDLNDNSDYQDITVEGIEDCCIRCHAVNHIDTPVSGEVWITMDVNTPGTVADIQANGFRIFSGIALQPNEERDFTCQETLALLENVDQLSNAVSVGKFKVWGLGNESIYCFTLSNVYIGMHITGSI